MPAVFVHERHPDGDVHDSELRIRGERSPRVVFSDSFITDLRAAFPCFRAEFARLRHEVEEPELPAGADVEATDIPGDVANAYRVVAVDRRVGDDDHVVHDDRGRAVGDLAVLRIDADCAIGAGASLRVPLLAGTRGAIRRSIADDQ